MTRRLLLINLVLVVAIATGAYDLISNWQEFSRQHATIPIALADSAAPELAVPGPERLDPVTEFLTISEHNLFVPDRGTAPEEGAEDAGPPPLNVTPTLVSVYQFGGEWQGVLNVTDGRRNRDGGESRRTVKVGDSFEGYFVKEIREDRLILGWQEHEIPIELDLSAAGASPRQAAQSRAAVNIITVGTAQAAVETTSPESQAEEEARGLQVSSVAGGAAGQAGAAGGAAAGVAGRGGRAGLAGQQGVGNRGVGGVGNQFGGRAGLSGRSNLGRSNFNRNNRGGTGTVGGGTPQAPPPQN